MKTPPCNYIYTFGSILSVLILTAIALVVYNNKQKVERQRTIATLKEPLFQQSPQYRYPTKCFDCVKQESQNHLNVSHGGRTSVGL